MKIVNLHSILVTLSLGFLLVTSRVKQCGKQGGGARCPEGQCCSNFGWCGTTYPYCAPENCQSQCPTPSPPPVPPPPPPPPPFNPPPPPSPPPPPPFNPPPPPPPVLPPPSFNPPPPPPPVLPPPSFNPPPPPPPVLPPPSFNPPPPPPPPPPPSFTPPPPVSPHDISNIITESLFEEMLPYRNDPRCPAEGFYTYDSFISSARNFPAFGTTGSIETRKREIAAFLAQTSHETTGGWPDAPGGPYSWGYCFIEEVNADGDYCVPSDEWTCVPGEKYFGRGPIQLSYNYNYGPAGQALGLDLLSNPDLVATDSTVSFETAFWFWMTAQYSKPSCHEVITETWEPSPADIEANRLPGFGVTTNIINGGLECGHGPDDRVADRIGFFKRYCDLLGISPGDNLDCYDQSSFGVTLTNPRFYGLLKMPVDQA